MIQKTIQSLHNNIDGKWVPGESSFQARNPANDQVIAAVPESTPCDVDTAAQAARIAFAEWRHVNPAVHAGRGR